MVTYGELKRSESERVFETKLGRYPVKYIRYISQTHIELNTSSYGIKLEEVNISDLKRAVEATIKFYEGLLDDVNKIQKEGLDKWQTPFS